jgi:DNA-binding MarR family transcriptional regulator
MATAGTPELTDAQERVYNALRKLDRATYHPSLNELSREAHMHGANVSRVLFELCRQGRVVERSDPTEHERRFRLLTDSERDHNAVIGVKPSPRSTDNGVRVEPQETKAIACDVCGKRFPNQRGCSIHKGRSHKEGACADEAKRAPGDVSPKGQAEAVKPAPAPASSGVSPKLYKLSVRAQELKGLTLEQLVERLRALEGLGIGKFEISSEGPA